MDERQSTRSPIRNAYYTRDRDDPIDRTPKNMYIARARVVENEPAATLPSVVSARGENRPAADDGVARPANVAKQLARVATRDDDDHHFITAAAPEVVASSVPETISSESFRPLLFYVFM